MAIDFHTQDERGRKKESQREHFFAGGAPVRQDSKILSSIEIFPADSKNFRVPVHSSQDRGLMQLPRPEETKEDSRAIFAIQAKAEWRSDAMVCSCREPDGNSQRQMFRRTIASENLSELRQCAQVPMLA